jgi:hypothetical protein
MKGKKEQTINNGKVTRVSCSYTRDKEMKPYTFLISAINEVESASWSVHLILKDSKRLCGHGPARNLLSVILLKSQFIQCER